jgi:hypothetical protein
MSVRCHLLGRGATIFPGVAWLMQDEGYAGEPKSNF